MATQNKRKSISKKTRFEVFKRDCFTCQYCGQKVPDVVLELDHIVPIAEGGSDDIVNLTTGCYDCNRGKGKIKLTQITRKDITEINEKLKNQNEQIKLYYKFLEKNLLLRKEDPRVSLINKVFDETYGFSLNNYGKASIKKLLDRRDDVNFILECFEIASARVPIENNVTNFFKYACGVFHNKITAEERENGNN